MDYAHPDSLVSTEWLAAHVTDPAVRVVDGSFKLPGNTPTAREDYDTRHIPGAPFFDVDEIADHSSPLPHMLPRAEEFAEHMSRLGIGDGTRVVAYDATGWSMACWRVWWMLRVYGHDNVAILRGGLATWVAEGRPVTAEVPRPAPAKFTPRFRPELVRDKTGVRRTIGAHREQVVDARAQARFEGTAPEPRPGIRSGHIPGSRNLPYDQLADPATKTPLPRETLEQRFRAAGLTPDRPIVASCGSGVTACALAFGLHLIGWPEAAVYDGSWVDWGAVGDTPVETGPAS
ncbi:MAG TPA: 3-mercaptopyruvate sulfurtransferase [Stellaceae bacterium]|jgi:thiosulfate/3-mercaptopyruvate sulfurtransferase|nr:3-mercaptopyruvate sulfurtransferase [Stellaceae bacterium]